MAINENQSEQSSEPAAPQQLHTGARPAETRKERLYEIIFEADTKAGKLFDVVLLIAILMSVLVVMLESVESLHERYGTLLVTAEWIFTILFTGEYLVRLSSSKRPLRYMFLSLIHI